MLEGFRHLRHELGVPEEFPDEVLADAEQAANRGPTLPPGAHDRVRDARDIEFVAIDPEGSMDLDQAYSAIRVGQGATGSITRSPMSRRLSHQVDQSTSKPDPVGSLSTARI